MKIISAPLQTHLDSGTTTLCHCWRLTLRSGEKIGFTDCDEPLTFDGTVFEAQAGFDASEIQSSIGLNVDNLEAAGALQSTKLDSTRLSKGDYDHAKIEIWLVNWQDSSQRILQRKGNLGEVTYGQGHFTAEVRGLAHLMNQEEGRLFQYGCDAILGDGNCGVNLNSATYQSTAIVLVVDGNALQLSGLQSYTDDWFTRGTLRVGIANLEIKRHRKFASFARIELWSAPKIVITVGSVVTVQAGCDKQFSTCQSKFVNAPNFRGFPHMPGNDFVLSVANSADQNDGLKRSF